MGKKRNAKAEEDNGTYKKPKIHEKQIDRREESPEWFSTPPNNAAPALSNRKQKKQKRAEEYKKRRNAAADPPPKSIDTPVSTDQQKPEPVVSGTIKLESMVSDTVQQAIPSASNSEQSSALPMPNVSL